MDIQKEQADFHSKTDFVERFSTLVDSGAGIIHVRTQEVVRALLAIREQAVVDGAEIREWDVVNGFRDVKADKVAHITGEGDSNTDFTAAFAEPLESLRKSTPSTVAVRYYVFVNPHVFMEGNPFTSQLVTLYGSILPASSYVVVLLTPDTPIQGVSENVLSLHFNPPGLGELRESLEKIVADVEEDFEDGSSLSDDDINRICYVGSGLTKNAFDMYAALSLVEAGRRGATSIERDDIVAGITIGKTDVVNASEVLELYPSTDIANVGGLENLKDWVNRRKGCYSDDAKEFGVEPPKGIVLVGVPGSGKSLIAKAISSELGIPLVRMDFGKVFSSLVGSSEARMRSALRQVEAMSPVVLFADEVDKGLGGIGGSNDSGVSNRVLGSFLTWLQDCKKPVFVMVTANNVTGLPPEMLRRGRFDAIFSTTMPTATERREVLKIHLRIRGRDIADFPKEEVDEVVKLSEGYVPAEIESCVKDGLVDAFSEEEDFTMSHVVDALKSMVPLSVAFADKIKQMAEWAEKNATPAGKAESVGEAASVGNARRISNRRRR